MNQPMVATILLLVSLYYGACGDDLPDDGLVIEIDGNKLPGNRLRWSLRRDLNLTCHYPGSATVQLDWALPRESVPDIFKRFDHNLAILTINNVSEAHAGSYRCFKRQNVSSKQVDISMLLIIYDENTPSCGKGFFQCPNMGHCIRERFLCDGKVDCEDGRDESEEECGYEDPCNSKLACQDGRCMDPTLCCDPQIHTNCTLVPPCCNALLISNRHFYKLGRSREVAYLHSSIYIVTGCCLAFIILTLAIVLAVCRLQAKRAWWDRLLGGYTREVSTRGASRPHPPVTLQDLDAYFSSLRQIEAQGENLITYNINNGVQILGSPPPYEAHLENRASDAPPPYREPEEGQNRARIIQDPQNQPDDGDVGDTNNEGNNNGDINGNSDMMDHNVGRPHFPEEVDVLLPQR